MADGHIFRADTILKLADQIGIDGDGLSRSVEKWNERGKTGKDERFSKGRDEYQRLLETARLATRISVL